MAPFQSGSHVGQYEILAPIGAGGMGVVYRSRDTKLKREVAIKVLPAEWAQDSERIQRFRREAEILATLNHPHVAQIYGLEEAGETICLVLELVEGETLADRLKRGAIPVDEAVVIAGQIAEGLEAAHDKGIIHRDLKPANIKINPDGNIKVLDFGLAKALGEEPPAANLSNSPTLSMQATGQGIILGTAAYMAPEQARGLAVDKRADIFAFGCVLYEMLAGRQAFGGELVSDILASVLVREPDYTAVPHNLNPRIKELLRRCLAKDPKRRWQAAGDVRLELEYLAAEPVGMAVPSADAATDRPKGRWRTPLLAAGFLVAALLSGLAVWVFKPVQSRPVTRFHHVLPEGQQFTNQSRPLLAVSPDGSNIAYVANNQIYLRALNEFEAHAVPGTNGGPSTPVFSPDGQWIGYWVAAGQQLKKISIRGGAPVVLCNASAPFGMSWSTDGTLLFGQPEGILRVSENGGKPELVVATKPGEQAYGPQLLPGGNSLLFSLSTGGAGLSRWDQAAIVVHFLKTGERKVLIGGSDALYIPTGHLIYALGDTLFAVAFDPDDSLLSGGPVPIASGVRRSNGNTAAANYSVSTNGQLTYVAGSDRAFTSSLVWVDRKGRAEPVQNLPQRRSYLGPRLSPNNRRIAVVEEGDIWIYELDRGGSIRLTRDGSSNRPAWDPKGLRIAYSSTAGVAENILVRPSDGSGEAQQITKGQLNHLDSWSPDGRLLFFHRHESSVPSDLLALSFSDSGVREQVVLKQPSADEGGQLSPDGNWIAYYSNESGQAEIYITPYPGPGGKHPVSTGGGTEPVWARNGDLFYRSLDLTRLYAVKVTTKPALQIGKPEMLFEGQYQLGTAGGSHPGYDVTADGQRFLMLLSDAPPVGSRPQINVVQNWFAELRQRVPVP